MDKKIGFIDVAKGIGIILVVLGHMRSTTDITVVKTIILTFHMPLFFFIAGYTFNLEKYIDKPIEFFKNKFKRMIVPYILFSFFLIIFLSSTKNELTIYDKMFSVLYGVGTKFWTWDMIPLWFLLALFCANVFFYILLKYTRVSTEIQILALALSSLVGYELSRRFSKGYCCPWSFELALIALVFMYAGWKCKTHALIERMQKHKPIIKIIVFLMLAIIWIFVIVTNGRVDMNARRFSNLLEFYVGGISGSLIVIWISIMLSKVNVLNKCFGLLGRNSLYILIFHSFSGRFYFNVLSKIFPAFRKFLLENVDAGNSLAVVWGILASLVIAAFLKLVIRTVNKIMAVSKKNFLSE